MPRVLHETRGRARLELNADQLNGGRRAAICAALDAHPAVLRHRLNPAARSLVIEYSDSLNVRALQRLVARARPGAGEAPQSAVAAAPPRLGRFACLAAGTALAVMGQPLSVPLIAVGAAPLYARARRHLVESHRIGVDALDAAAVTLTLGSGQWVTAGLTAGLVEMGEWMRDLTASQSRRALGELMAHNGDRCWRIERGRRVRVGVRNVRGGDLLALGPGDRVPVDGVVTRGRALMEEKLLTGEPLPALREPGNAVFAMTTVTDGEIVVRASGNADDSRAARIRSLLEQAPLGDTRMADHARLLADRFVIPVLATATVVGAGTWRADRAASILIFDFASGIRVAAPTTMLASLLAAARRGILIKGAAAVEKLAVVDTIVFDKTGTLTAGQPAVARVRTFNGLRPERVLGIAAAANQGVNHPLAEALGRAAAHRAVDVPAMRRSSYEIGRGVLAQLEVGGDFVVGNRTFMELHGIEAPPSNGRRPGESEVFIGSSGECLGAVYLRDEARPDAASVLNQLRTLGVRRLLLVSGDTHGATGQLAQSMGVGEWHARMTPEAKAELVRDLQASGHTVAVVGDGLNDSLAFSRADVPVAMGRGAEQAKATASVILLEDRLQLLPEAISAARHSMRVMNQNLAAITVANLAGLVAAVATPLQPALAALISNGTTLAAAANGLRPLVHDAIRVTSTVRR